MHFFLGNRKLVKADEESAAEGIEGLAKAVDSGMSADGISAALTASVTPESYGITGNGVPSSIDKWQSLLSSGKKIQGSSGAVYAVNEGIVINDIEIDFDLSGSTIINASPSERMILAYYPYYEVQDISAVNLTDHEVTVSDSSVYEVGDRVKIVSGDRCDGNRPAPGDGTNYWQAQSLTISGIDDNTIEFREPFEEDFTFVTNPKIMKINKKSCRIYNGSMYSEKGYQETRNNGIIRIFGGSNHKISIDIENSNSTAIEFQGADYPKVKGSSISSVGRDTDTSGSHGISFISCNSPSVNNCDFNKTRHAQTNNDTATLYDDDDYYQMGPTYDMRVSNCSNHGDIAGGFSTHHGIRRAKFSNLISYGCSVGIGIRGRDVTVDGIKCEMCDEGVFVYSESDVATEDKTTRWYVTNAETVDITGANDLQVQSCQFGTLGSNNWKGGAPWGWFFNSGGTVAVHGHQEFFSDAEFYENSNYLHIVNTNVESFGSMSIDIDSMTTNGANDVIGVTSDKYFKSHGKIVIDEPVGVNKIYSHIGTGDTLLSDVVYLNDIGFPFNAAGGDIKFKGGTYDGAYTTKYQIRTISDNWDLSMGNSIDDEITVVGLLNGDYTLSSMPEGKFVGQKLLLRVVDSSSSYSLTVFRNASNIDSHGVDIDMVDNSAARFVWTGSVWFLEFSA